MRRSATSSPMRFLQLASIAALLVVLLGASAVAGPTKRVAKQVDNATLGKVVLTNLKGRTLYSLSAETKGRFVCTGPCLSTWRPLVVPADTKPIGPVKLGQIQRPDGRTQVTYKGRPLYGFSGDSRAGDVNGEGIVDVGTWHAATTGRVVAPQPQPQPQPENPYPY